MEQEHDYMIIWYSDEGIAVAAKHVPSATREDAHKLAEEQAPIQAVTHEVRRIDYITQKENAYMTISVHVGVPGVPSAALRAVFSAAIKTLEVYVYDEFETALRIQLKRLCSTYGITSPVLKEWTSWNKNIDLVSVEVEVR